MEKSLTTDTPECKLPLIVIVAP